MKTPRLTRLGLVSVASALALVGAVLSPAQAAGPTTPDPDMVISKAWTPPLLVNHGTTVTAVITVDNSAGLLTPDVVVSDVFDPALDFVSAVATGGGVCTDDATVGFRRVDCTFASIGAGATETITLTFDARYWGYRHYTRNYRTEERLEIQKAETHVDILSGQSTVATVTCPAGFDILDASWHLQQVDQGTGDFYDVYRMSSSINNNSATVTLFNDAAGKAQGKLWALCLKDTTNQGHPVGWNAQTTSTRVEEADGPDERPFYAECPLGYTPMAINISAVPGVGADPDATYMDDVLVQTGLEADGGQRATIWAIVKDQANVTLKWRCLSTSIGANRLWFQNVDDSYLAVPVQDKVAKKQIDCDHHYKGVIGGWRGGKFNGSEPRPKTRVYWLWYEGPTVQNFEGSLLCLHTRLFRGGKVQKNGSITDELHNHARGTTDNGGFYLPAVEPVAPMVVRQTS